jgi:hypothetical protein
MQQYLTHGSSMLMRRIFTDVDHQSNVVAVDLSAAASVCRRDPSF